MASVTSEIQYRIITFTSCCDREDVLKFRYTGGNYGSLVYPSPSLPAAAGFSNTCYQVKLEFTDFNEWFSLPNSSLYPPALFTKLGLKEPKCEDFVFPNGCPECPTQCYTLYNCEGQFFNTTNDLSDFVYETYGYPVQLYEPIGGDIINGTWYVYINDGPCTTPDNDFAVNDVTPIECECRCFEILLNSSKGSITNVTYINCDGELITNTTATRFCSKISPIVNGQGFTIVEGDVCIDGTCPIVCYKLTNCDTGEIIYSTLQTLYQYVGKIVKLADYEGCWEVDVNNSINCDCITVTIETRGGVTEYTANIITPYNGWNRWTFVIGSDNYYIWNSSLNPLSNWIISKDSSGPIPGQTYAESKSNDDCPELISDGTLTGWVIAEEVPWINVQTEVCPGVCECPVDIIVLQSFDTCKDCLPVIAYRLQNCEKIYEVQYTTQDLSEYVGSVIETDCGCWTVTQIDVVPPSETLVIIDNVFKTCNECLSTYYLLQDCAGEVGDIVTTTDLSTYVGQVIKIENCDTCWEVTKTREFTELSNVVVVQNFETCEDCGVPTVCECTKVTNLNQTKKTYTYYDCNNVLQSITLQPGESSDKVCALYWVTEPLFCSCIMFEVEGSFYYAFIVLGELINGKPVYNLCDEQFNCGTVYWDGFNWVIANPDGTTVVWILLSSTSGDCPYGEWTRPLIPPKPGVAEAKEKAPAIITSEPCDLDICTCIQVSIDNGTPITFYTIAIDSNGYPLYTDGISSFIYYEQEVNEWVAKIEILGFAFTLDVDPSACPIGTWTPEKQSTQTVVSTACPPPNNEFTVFDHFEVFGECKNGVCPPPVFKNNRTVRPGYNTPICTPAKYDEITCRFADIIYKIVLEKRYGITNCCPDEDDKWLIKKELIDLQALKDPNYNCQECSCGCNSVNTCSTCNCKN